MALIEQWVTLKHHTDYEVSNMGRIRRIKTQHIVKQKANKWHKNPTVRLKDALWGQVQLTACWLIYNAFHNANYEDASYCNGQDWCDFLKKGHRMGHRDGDRTNNALANLYLY